LVLAVASVASAADPASITELRRGFLQPPANCRIMVRWWWFGPAVTKPELARELEEMRQGGIGGFEVQPVYPLALDNPSTPLRNLPYLSPEFLDDLRFTAEKARELRLRFDLTLGSGWPFGGPHIPLSESAGRLRIERGAAPDGVASVAVPKLEKGENLLAAFLMPGSHRLEVNGARMAAIPAGTESGRHTLFFIAGHTNMMVKRAAVGAEGLVLDHYDRAAIETHLSRVGDTMMKALGPFPPYAVFSDSLEVYQSDWTGDLPDQFRRRRGYDLIPYLPALVEDIGDRTAAIRHDWGLTLTELANENYLARVEAWADRHGTLFRSQTYGIPPVNLSSNALVDLPEGEGWQWRGFTATRWASSASHLYGRPVTSSETWTWLHSPVFRATPLDMKAEADLHFLQGINQLVGHGWPYSPPSAGALGWTFYAAAALNRHNPWWLVMPDVTKYLQRVSYLLRQGKPVTDVALYLPTHDAYAGFAPGHDSVNQAMDALLGPNTIGQILKAGYNLDFIDDAAIAKLGIAYRALVLPNVERIPPETYRKIALFAAGGGIVMATGQLPSRAPGFRDEGSETAAVRDIGGKLFAAKGAGYAVRDDAQLGVKLRELLPPDLTASPEIGFVHRRLPFAEIYFLANTANRTIPGEAVFRVAGMTGRWWKPLTGEEASAAGGSHVDIALAPYESRVIVFTRGAASAAPPPGVDTVPQPLDLSEDWQVTFPGASAPVSMKTLRSWTSDEQLKYFSGEAVYRKTFQAPPRMLRSGRALYLDFGEGTPIQADTRKSGPGFRALLDSPVREAAVVTVNGRRAGAVWCPPYRIDITRLLRAGSNEIRVTVANLGVNAMAGAPRPDYRELNARYGERFQPQDMDNVQPVPAGILGTVRLVAR
jgi:hypothetical protein